MVDGPYTHHNGVAQVFAGDGGGTVFVWTADLLPEEAAPGTAEAMQQGVAAVKRTLEAAVSARTQRRRGTGRRRTGCL